MDDFQEPESTVLEILEEKGSIKYNPFSNMPKTSLKKALDLLEEYSEEITEP